MRILSQKEIEKYYEKCDFDDGCDFCKDPRHGIYAKIDYIPEDVAETDFYICGKCASESIPKMIEAEKLYYDGWAKYIDENPELLDPR